MAFPPKKDAKKGDKKPNPFAKGKAPVFQKGKPPQFAKGGMPMKEKNMPMKKMMKGC